MSSLVELYFFLFPRKQKKRMKGSGAAPFYVIFDKKRKRERELLLLFMTFYYSMQLNLTEVERRSTCVCVRVSQLVFSLSALLSLVTFRCKFSCAQNGRTRKKQLQRIMHREKAVKSVCNDELDIHETIETKKKCMHF